MGAKKRNNHKLFDDIVRIGCMSRIDYGSEDYREGLLVLAQDAFQEAQPDILIIVGGLVSNPAIKNQLKSIPNKEREAALAEFIERAAQDLASALPKIEKSGEAVKTYIMLSPSNNYDGPFGKSVAMRLIELRDDIRLWGKHSKDGFDSFVKKGDERFPLHHVNKTMMVITPVKSQWASRFYSTPVDRLIREKEQQTSISFPDFYVVGCFASNLLKPRGEFLRPYISVPALHRLGGVITAENQIGVKIIDVSKNELRSTTKNFKDFMGPEYALITFPKGISLVQKRILRALIDLGPLTVGMLAREVASCYRKNGQNGINEDKWREKIQDSINLYQQNNCAPQIFFDSAAKRYYISPDWFRKYLRYTLPRAAKFAEDSILIFGCLHSGARATDYKFCKEDLPRIILDNDVDYIVCAGDLIIGLKHDLMLHGETIGSLNVTDQEELAAFLIGRMMATVFLERIKKICSGGICKNKPSKDEIKKIIRDSLPYFIFIPGNHDEWQEESGVTPLAFFHEKLKRIIFISVQSVLDEYDISLKGVYEIVEEKIVALDIKNSKYSLPSGLCMEISHPRMARAQTSSLRAQSMLYQSSCQMVFGANFHVGIAVEEWSPEIGQRIALLVGTFLTWTKFEKGKLKGRLDFGPGLVRVKSLNGRISEVESTFFDQPTGEYFDDIFTLKYVLERLGLYDEKFFPAPAKGAVLSGTQLRDNSGGTSDESCVEDSS